MDRTRGKLLVGMGEDSVWRRVCRRLQGVQQKEWQFHIPSSLRCLDGSCTRRALQDWAVLDFFPQFGQSGRSVVLLFLPGRFAWLAYGASPFNRDGNTVSQPWASCPPGHRLRCGFESRPGHRKDFVRYPPNLVTTDNQGNPSLFADGFSKAAWRRAQPTRRRSDSCPKQITGFL